MLINSSSMENVLENIKEKTGYIIDMDGVIYHGNRLLPGVTDFLAWLESSGKKYLFLTNSSERTPKELHEKLKRLGIDVGEDHFIQVRLPLPVSFQIRNQMEAHILLVTPDLFMLCTV